MKTYRTTRIMVIAAFLAIVTASAPLWAQDWPAWDGTANADKKEWDEMGQWYANAKDIFRLLGMANEVRKFRSDQKEGVAFWKKNKDKYQSALAAAQKAEEQAAEKKRLADEQKKQADEQKRLAQEKAEADKKAARDAAIDAANAAGVTAADFTVEVTSNGSGLILSKYTGLATIVTVPTEIEGLPVKYVSFSGNKSIERVTVPAGISAFFEQCSNLRGVTLPAGLTTIGNSAFNISGLESIVIPDSVTTIGDYAFSYCKNLPEVMLPKNLAVLGSRAFAECSSLKRITIPAKLQKMGHNAFQNCTALEEITFEGNVDLGDYNAFTGCHSIKKLNAGPKVTKIQRVELIPGPNVAGLPLKEQAELKAAWSAFVQKYR